MDEMIKVAVDAMGGDNAPGEIVKGAVEAILERNNIKVFLVGKKEAIEAELFKYQIPSERVEVIDAREEISCDEAPVMAIRKKKDSSMVVALNLVKEGKADAFVSAGSSGAVLVGGQLIIGRIKGIERAPLATLMPNKKGVSLLIDCGANVDARESHLLQFAKMGSIYMEHVVGIKNPRVAIVNIGAEEAKGNNL
ncbi:MAG: phosphate acyltransferase, partial [Lachnospiraceae bacterium]|nr:phosphate acyltransferase [Lachnospiraceae bacterium]